MKKSKKSIRLVSHVWPERYNLTLKPDLESFTFSGKEIVDIVLDKEVKEITLHSKDIAIKSVELCEQFANNISYDEKAETATFYFKKPIQKGKAKLNIVFSGIINDSLRGFYKSKYEIDGVTKHIATTQFEATDARRAFPCFDEPIHKAIFDVSLIISKNHTAISNTLPIEIKEHENFKVVSFAPTPKMSTYLLAFIIGEFEYVEGFTHDKVQVRVFTTAGKKHQANFALDVAIKSLHFYNQYFDIPYPLPTLDLIAIPDFESAAMENWGAVTFRETAILVDDEHTSLATKQWTAIVIAHELAHQWFGNLVTMEWWTDLWLNEGFASYMENLCIDNIFPRWKVWELNLADRYSVALKLDALNNSHPVEVTVHHPNEINEIFDMVSYAKGSAIIRMLAEYLGEEKFREGLRYYLKKHSYENTETTNLWEAFEKVSGKPISKIMGTWTKQTGYPLISVDERNKLTQERFFSSRISRKKNKSRQIWQIPLDKMLIDKKSIPLKNKKEKLNKGEISFVRVKYNKETLNFLKKQIIANKLPTADRLGVIRDLFALAEGGYIDTDIALDFSLAYENETEYIVWSELTSGMNRVYHIISDESFKDEYKKYALSLFSPLAKRMGWKPERDEHHSHTFLRNLALSQSGFYGDKEVTKEAIKLFILKNKSIPADIRGVIYSIVARNGGEQEWKSFEKLYKEEKMQEEKDRYVRALASFTDKKLLSKTLEFAVSENVRAQDAPFIITATWQNSEGRDLTWNFIKKNWQILLKKYGEGGHFLGRILSPLGTHIKTKDADDAKKFFKSHPAPGAERTLEQSYERIYSNSAWIKADKKSIQNWLSKNF